MIALITLPLLLISQPGQTDQATFPPLQPETVRVDRGLQLTVYPDRIRLQYDLGLSPPAAAALLVQKSRHLPETDDRRLLMEAIRDLVVPEIQQRCRMMANGQPLTWHPVEAILFPKHYVQLACIFEAPLPPAGENIHLQLTDGSLRSCDGTHSIAVRAKGGARIQTSTAPLILARVPRQLSSNDSAAQREAARRAEAVVLRPQNSTDATTKLTSGQLDAGEADSQNPGDEKSGDENRRLQESVRNHAQAASKATRSTALGPRPVARWSAATNRRWTFLAVSSGCFFGVLALLLALALALLWRRRRC